jgi:hypothetical protein
MRKQRSNRETKNMIQTALWLPREMHQQLKKKAGERGLGEEIRRRLRASFEFDEPPDKTTDILISAINQLAIELEGPWYANSFTFEVLKAAINDLLSQCRATEQAGLEAVAKLQATFPNENPETLGRIFARVALHYYKNQPRWPSYPGREDRSAHKLGIRKPLDGTQPSPANEREG